MVWADSMFQFLIGTVKTMRALENNIDIVGVSIPHRYCKNQFRECITTSFVDWFQFLIGTVKT